MDQSEKALSLFVQGLNCAQAIVEIYGQGYGIDKDGLLKITAGFAGGCETGGTCGALLGGVIVLGLKFGDDPYMCKKYTYLLMDTAKEKFGGTSCRELLGCDISTNEGGKKIQRENLFQTICPHVIEKTIMFLRDYLKPSSAIIAESEKGDIPS